MASTCLVSARRPDNRLAVVVLTSGDFSDAASSIADKLQHLLVVASSPAESTKTDQAKGILEALRHGKIDRSLLTPNCNDYFSAGALQETAHALAKLGATKSFDLTGTETRGGMDARWYRAALAKKTLTVIERSLPDGHIEQYLVAPE